MLLILTNNGKIKEVTILNHIVSLSSFLSIQSILKSKKNSCTCFLKNTSF